MSVPQAPQRPTLTVFGATGGCAATALGLALRAGIDCVAMVRTPAKLRDVLVDGQGVPAETLDTRLTVVQGSIRAVEDVKRALTVTGRLTDMILFTVGGSPIFRWLNPVVPVTLDDPHVCEEGMKNLIAALRTCHDQNVPLGPRGGRPVLITISTISMSDTRRDLPFLLYPLEYWFLAVPRADKKAMEKVIFAAAAEPQSPLGDFAMVRPPLLAEGPAKGPDKVRAGWVYPDEMREEKLARGCEREMGPQIGYFVTKADVGRWIFDNLIQGDGSRLGKCWTLAS